MHDAAHATALGKCILGQLPAIEREDYLARHPLHDLTPRTVVDRRRLHLPATGGIAVDDGEYAIGVCCLAATVTTGHDAGAVGVVTTPRQVGRPDTRQTLLLGAEPGVPRPGPRHGRLTCRHLKSGPWRAVGRGSTLRPWRRRRPEAPDWAVRALSEVYDPCCREKGISVVDMGLLRSVEVSGTATRAWSCS